MNTILYEQPMNESISLCLRLEYLFVQIKHYIVGRTKWDSHNVLKTLLEILQTIDRPDIKNQFFQTLNQYNSYINLGHNQLETNNYENQINNLINKLRENQKKIGYNLRNNEFLNSIQQRLYIPAGTCGFSLPAYDLWLQQDVVNRQQELIKWFESLKELQEIVEKILILLRKNSYFYKVTANKGFYKKTLDRNTKYRLIRIKINNNKNIYPKISVGKYQIAIHFFILNLLEKTSQVFEDINFYLSIY